MTNLTMYDMFCGTFATMSSSVSALNSNEARLLSFTFSIKMVTIFSMEGLPRDVHKLRDQIFGSLSAYSISVQALTLVGCDCWTGFYGTWWSVRLSRDHFAEPALLAVRRCLFWCFHFSLQAVVPDVVGCCAKIRAWS